MKKLTNKQLKALISTGAFTKSGEINNQRGTARYIDELAVGRKAYQLRSSGTGRNTKYITVAGAECAADVLEACGYKVLDEHDAPRGGALGDHYRLARKINVSAAEIEAQVINYIKEQKC